MFVWKSQTMSKQYTISLFLFLSLFLSFSFSLSLACFHTPLIHTHVQTHVYFLLCLFESAMIWLWRERKHRTRRYIVIQNGTFCRWLFFPFDTSIIVEYSGGCKWCARFTWLIGIDVCFWFNLLENHRMCVCVFLCVSSREKQSEREKKRKK